MFECFDLKLRQKNDEIMTIAHLAGYDVHVIHLKTMLNTGSMLKILFDKNESKDLTIIFYQEEDKITAIRLMIHKQLKKNVMDLFNVFSLSICFEKNEYLFVETNETKDFVDFLSTAIQFII